MDYVAKHSRDHADSEYNVSYVGTDGEGAELICNKHKHTDT